MLVFYEPLFAKLTFNVSFFKSLKMRVFLLVFLIFSAPFNALAQTRSAQNTEGIGTLAGVVLACGAYRQLYQFEEILSRYFSNTSPTQAAEDAALRLYATAKANSYIFQRGRSKRDCAQTIADFSKMDIFKFELYSDGTLKTPNGQFLYPRGQRKLADGAVRTYPKTQPRK